VETFYAVDEALRLISEYLPPDSPAVPVAPREASGCGWSEAPRGLLWHRYALAADGTVRDARIVPPTAQNQARIEQSLHGFVERHAALDDEELRLRCEQAIRSYDPCISCATHFLTLTVDRR
jgi:coenzyme F420-reducing hydrogenase alpha subunit